LDAFALNSHVKAKAATEAGAFANEIVAVEIETPEGIEMHTIFSRCSSDSTFPQTVLGEQLWLVRAACSFARLMSTGLRLTFCNFLSDDVRREGDAVEN
ncbi:MAG: hypothetical protein AAFY42_01015, partial [Pseudomonadota bacterium]